MKKSLHHKSLTRQACVSQAEMKLCGIGKKRSTWSSRTMTAVLAPAIIAAGALVPVLNSLGAL